MVTALDAGRGAAEVLARPGSGQVVSVHRRAAYVRVDGDLIALVASGVEPGPVHVRCTALPVMRPGEAVTVDGRGLVGRTWTLRTPTALWRGALPDPVALTSRAGDAVVCAVARTAPPDAVAVLQRPGDLDDLDELAAVLGGRGPGLTPAGDDVLAGVLLVARILGGPAVEARLRRVAEAVPTTEVARAFLRWAAQGQSIAPVHDWLLGLAAGDDPAARRALARLHAIGADSGRSLAAGLAVGLASVGAVQLPRSAIRTARAGAVPGLRHCT